MEQYAVHAQSLAETISRNDFWNKNKIEFKCATVRELVLKRLNWWCANMEGDIREEAPMYSSLLRTEVMRIFDTNAIKIKEPNYFG